MARSFTPRRLGTAAARRSRPHTASEGRRTHLDVQEKKGRKTFSRGVWARQTGSPRSGPSWRRNGRPTPTRSGGPRRARRERKQSEYVEDFRGAVLAFLDFAPCYADLAEQLADAVTQHATPVGSGTVARTQRIPIERRAESAVIAWLRHATTAYDNMKIPRDQREAARGPPHAGRAVAAAAGEVPRRAVRLDPTCPLRQALSNAGSSPS